MSRSFLKSLVLLGTIALLMVAVAGLPAAASARGDKDCADFPSQKSAQIFFIKHGGPRYDPDRLDGDHDGKACEDNPAPYYFGSRLP